MIELALAVSAAAAFADTNPVGGRRFTPLARRIWSWLCREIPDIDLDFSQDQFVGLVLGIIFAMPLVGLATLIGA